MKQTFMKARAQVEGGLLPVFSSILLFLAFLAEKTLEVFLVVFKWRRDETYGVKCGVSLSSKDYLRTSNQLQNKIQQFTVCCVVGR